MALSISSAPVYGGSTLAIEFAEDKLLPAEAKYYLVYEGSVQRHVTTARLLSPHKLHSIVPGHQQDEQVQLSVISFHGNEKTILVTSPFHFHNDGAFYLAQYLIDSVYSPVSLEDLELIKTDEFDLANEDLSSLDERLSRSLAQLEYPEWWSVLGSDEGKEDPEPRQTVLHFAAHLGLQKSAIVFLRKRGSYLALSLANKNGDLPKDIAIAKNHYKLIDIFSDCDSHGLFPLDQCFETEKGVVQMRDTGDITLTSNVITHHRTIEEDIIVLQGVQKQWLSKKEDPSKLMQEAWPEQTNTATVGKADLSTTSDEKLKTICDKVRDIPSIVSSEGEGSDTNIHEHDTDSTANGHYGSDDVDFSDDFDAAMEMDMLPEQTVSDDEETSDIMEESISKLHGYTEQLNRIRHKGTVFNRILEQDLRKETLARFSSSCPSLAVDCRNSPLPVIDEADHHRSMVDLGEDNERNADTAATPSSLHSRELYSSSQGIQDSSDDVHIIVEGATLGSSSDSRLQSQDYDRFLNEYYGGNIPQVRRRSFSPQVVKEGEPVDSSRFFSPTMVIHGTKSVNKFPSEGEDTDDDVYRERPNSDDVSMSDSNLSADSHSCKGTLNSQEDIYMDNESSVNDNDSPRTKGSTRGLGNKDRYSADIEYMVRQQMKEHHSGSALDKMSSSSARTSREEEVGLNLPHGKITKALSTSSIPAATKAEKSRGSGMKGMSQDSKHAQFHRQDEIEEEEPIVSGDSPEIKHPPVSRLPRKTKQMTFIDFLNDPNNFSNDAGPQSPKIKDEKKRKLNMFSKLHSSIRSKKSKDKEEKNKSSHRFVSVSFSNNTTCDMCHKPLSNKAALRCEVCLVNVHENSCKDQITPCEKYKPKSHPPRQSSTEGENAVAGQDKNQPVGVLRPSVSFKEKSNSRPQSFVGATTQPLPIAPDVQQESAVVIRKRRSALQSASAQLNRRSLPTPRILVDTSCLDDVKSRPPPGNLDKKKSRSPTRNRDSIKKSKSPTRHSNKEKKGNNVFTSPNTGTYLQWRRASAVAVDRPIAEESEIEIASRLDLEHSNIQEAICRSTESLDEVDSVQEVKYEDFELGNLMTEEPETWSETVDKKVLKKWSQKDVKRQDTIWELIQTERQFCKRLKTLQIFFRDGMLRDLGISSAWVERMFPRLDDLIYVHMAFLQDLQELQNRKPDRSVEFLGPTLNKQFSADLAKQMKTAYGAFCAGHLEAIQLYKDFVSKDRKFQAFIKQRMNIPICKKREIPDYILIITQRPTKYPILIEAVIKSTKDKKDRESLGSALELSKQILQSVDEQVAAAERQMRLKDIFNRLDTRSFSIHRGKKFKKSDITANGRRLLYEGVCGYTNARGKTVEVLAVLLNDVFFFLQDNNQKYSFFTQDNKNGVVSLYSLLVREQRNNTKDSKGMYIINQSKLNPEMYEVIFSSTLEMQRWARVMRAAAEKCPAEEDEEDPHAEEDRRRLEKQARAQAITDKLSAKDEEIKKCCDEKNKLMMDLLAIFSDTEDHHSRPSSRDFEDSPVEEMGSSKSSILQAHLQEAASQLASMLQGNGTNLSRSVSSVGEHASRAFTAVPMPKRAETFAGFDANHDATRAKKKEPGVDSADYSESIGNGDNYETSQLDLSQVQDAPPPLPQRMPFDNEADSDIGSSISTISAGMLSPASAIYNSQEHSNIASLVKTLNSIVHLTAQQSTAVESLRCQLAEANERITKLSVDVHEKKSGYKHNQLEELRNLQGVIQKEKEQWELKKERESNFMERETEELEEMRKKLEKQEADIKQQKEELNKKREVLQKQMDLLRQSGQLPNPDVTDTTRIDLDSDFVKGHRRSASAEIFPGKNDDIPSKGSVKVVPKESFRADQRPSVTKLQSFSHGSNKQNMPDHLLSATNEQKIGKKNVQQLPSKLLSGGLSDTTTQRQVTGSSASVSNSPDQGHGQTQVQGQSGANVSLGGHHGNYSAPSFAQDAHGEAKAHMGHSVSAGILGSQSNQHGSAVTVSGGNRQSNRPKQQASSGLTGVMKLAADNKKAGDKKGGRSTSTSQLGSDKGGSPSPTTEQSNQRPMSGIPEQRNPIINHKSQKSDSDVIYF